MVKYKRCSISLLLNYIKVCLSQGERKHAQIAGNDSPCVMNRQRLLYRKRQYIRNEDLSKQIKNIFFTISWE